MKQKVLQLQRGYCQFYHAVPSCLYFYLLVACNFNCIVETEGLLKITSLGG